MEAKKLAIVAIGGNSLISETEEVNVASEYKIVGETCRQIADLVLDGWDVVVTHGNGPQAGFNLRRSELASHELFELPMDVIVTFTQGSIGYYIQQNLFNIFTEKGVDKKIASVVTQIEVNRNDPAFENPSKPIGSYCEGERKKDLEKLGWPLIEEQGKGWRRLVASPLPLSIVEQELIEDLLAAGSVVITCGGGGVPVVKDAQGRLEGVPAIVDKDFSSALLAKNLKAELLIISTAVDRAALNFGQPDETWLDEVKLKDANRYLEDGHFGTGSMAPKIKAAINFIEGGGGKVIITSPTNIYKSTSGAAGTHIVP